MTAADRPHHAAELVASVARLLADVVHRDKPFAYRISHAPLGEGECTIHIVIAPWAQAAEGPEARPGAAAAGTRAP